MNRASSSYDRFQEVLRQEGVDRALDWLDQEFVREKDYAHLFEVLQLKARRQVGLELSPSFQAGPADSARQEQLEQLVYQACRRIGELLFREGQARQAWTYFQLVGDRPRAAELLRGIPTDESNAKEIVEVALVDGVDPVYGIELTLRTQGTCSAITRTDLYVGKHAAGVRDGCAKLLVRHHYQELTDNLRTDIHKREGKIPKPGPLDSWIESRPWLFSDGGHHVDPSHLQAVLRIGKRTTDLLALSEAREMSLYGMRLDPSLLASRDPSDSDDFLAARMYYDAALGKLLIPALEYFQTKLSSASSAEDQRRLAEVLVDLNCRNRRWVEALDGSLRWLQGEESDAGFVPGAIEIARNAKLLPRLAEWYRERGDLKMFALVLIEGQNSVT